MIVSFEGRMGQGKTLAMTGLALAEKEKSNRKLYATYHLHNVEYDYLDLESFYRIFDKPEVDCLWIHELVLVV